MRLSVIAVCAVLVAAGYYFFHHRAEADYRRDMLAQVEAISLDIAAAQLKIDAVQVYDANDKHRGWDVVSQEIRAARAARDDAVAKFFVLERKIKEANASELPGWLKDSRAWQSVDTKIKR